MAFSSSSMPSTDVSGVGWTVSTIEPNGTDENGGLELYDIIDEHGYAVALVCIATIGTIGNIMLFVLMCLESFRKFPYSVYLRYIAVFDTFVLIQTATEDTLEKFHGGDHLEETFYVNKVPCLFWHLPLTISRFISPWLLAALATDRFMLVLFPSRRHLFCTKFKAHLCVLVVTIASIVLQLPIFICDSEIACGVDTDFCTPFNENSVAIFIFYMVLRTDLPLLIIFVVSIWTIVALRRQTTAKEGESTDYSKPDTKRAVDRAIFGLIAVAFISFISLFPKAVVEVVEFIYQESYPKLYEEEQNNIDMAWHICNGIMLLNFAQNFYVLVLTSPIHRQTFLGKCRKNKSADSVQMTGMSTIADDCSESTNMARGSNNNFANMEGAT